MSDLYEIIEEIGNVNDQIDNLERRIDTLDRTFVKCTGDILDALKLQAGMITEIGTIISLIHSPGKDDLKRYNSLREAFDRYDFVRKLVLGKENKK